MKRIISLLIVAIMLLSMVPANLITAFAASDIKATINIEETSATRDSYVDIAVKITENPGIASMGLTLSFDEDLTLVEASNGEAFAELNMIPPAQLKKQGSVTGSCRFAWTGNDDCTEVGTMLNLKFKVSADAELNKDCIISITGTEGNVANSNREAVNVIAKDGRITIIDYIPGDVDDDGNISMLDVLTLSQYYVDGCKYDPNGYAVDILPESGDVDANGVISMIDVLMICQYYVDGCKYDPNGYGVTLLPGKRPCSHVMEVTAKVDATCTKDGNIAYWQCTECKKYFKDEVGNTEIKKEDTVVKASHDLEHFDAKAATTKEQGCIEHWKCAVCGKYFANSEATDELSIDEVIIPIIESTKSSVVYNLYGSDPYLESIGLDNSMNPTTFNSEDGLVLNDVVAPAGYTWKGWSTADGTPITRIESHSTSRQIVLNANWSKISYSINFASDMVPVESISYTTDREVKLSSPKLDKYTFVGWSDKNGNMYDTIPSGTVGDINLYANWASNRNRAVAVDKLNDPIILEDSENGIMLFTYEIGEIQNVPLFTTMKLNCVNGIITTHEKTNQKSISNEQAKTVAQTISNATTNSTAWTLSKSWNNTTEISESYLDQTGQIREEAETLAKSQSSTYNIGTSFGGSNTTTNSASGSYKLSGNQSHSTTNTTEKGQEFALSVDGKFSHEISTGANIGIPVDGLNLGVSAGRKTSFELGAGVDYSNYVKNTTSGTDSWSNSVELAGEKSASTTNVKNWNTSEGFSSSNSTSVSSSVSNTVSKLISQQYGYGKTYAEGGSNSESQELASTDTKSDEFSSTMTYYTSDIESTTTSFSSTGNTMGDYRLVMAGNVHVFAVVGYDVAKKTYFVYTYNVLDDTTEEYLDYSFDGSFDDYETSIIPFEVPSFVNDYVNNRIAKTDGLRVDPDAGVIDKYTAPESGAATIISIPSYVSVDNLDGTFKSVKITEISSDLFKNNKEVVGVILGHHIKEIPDNAFEGCTSLKYVICPGVTKIGSNAFKGCTSLEKFSISSDITSLGENAFEGAPRITAVASNKDVALAVSSSEAKNIVLDISNIPDDQNDGLEFVVPAIESFELQGKDKEYKDLSLKSDATNTIINGVKVIEGSGIAFDLSSENVTLNRVTVNSSGYAMLLTADSTNITLNGNNNLSTNSGNTLVCRNINLSPLSTSVVGKMNVSGKVLICGEIQGAEYINYDEIVYLSEDEYLQYEKGVFEITFDANGGVVETTSSVAYFGTKIGELPTPTRDGFTFDGWHIEDGTEVTAETVLTTPGDITLRAYWISGWVLASEVPEEGETVDTKYSYTLREYTDNSASSLSGWTKYNEEITSYGSKQGPVYTNPSNGVRKVTSEQYVKSKTTHYKYYHRYGYYNGQWCYGTDSTASSWARHTIDITSSLSPSWYSSAYGIQFYGTHNCPTCGNGVHWIPDGTYTTNNYSTRWYYQDPIYTYYYYRDLDKESVSDPTGQTDVSNVQKWVQYRAK